ncbi:MAG TPA: biotin/lipoyl-containing protein [Stellaceae bacterium]|nr:biotin/lipoyl-containing protein [Stellaceae bacterium]
MSLTAEEVSEIIRLLDASSFDELRLEIGTLKLTLRRGAAPETVETAPAPVPAAPQPKVAPPPPPDTSDLAAIPAPLLGIFYRAPKPGEPPFVEIGSRVEPDTVIAIIEVMKLMSPVRAGIAGEIVEILPDNATLVEYGQVLMRVREPG